MLTLHGVTKPIALSVNRNGDAYVGHAPIKQTCFGIKPISVGGGVIKVKNEVEIDFPNSATPKRMIGTSLLIQAGFGATQQEGQPNYS
jgi:hypothetical protein